jgi:hypothetical protein
MPILSAMQDFPLYFQLGWQHILDWKGYDHILFVVVLCGTYTLPEWRKVLILVTAFTIGHSITLALSVLSLIRINTALIEFLIPVTIVITAATNILSGKPKKKGIPVKYFLALVFRPDTRHGLFQLPEELTWQKHEYRCGTLCF